MPNMHVHKLFKLKIYL